MAVSDADANTTVMLHARLHTLSARKQGMKQVLFPQYQGQEIYLHDEDEKTSDSSSISSHDEDEGSDPESIAVFSDTITSEISVDRMSK